TPAPVPRPARRRGAGGSRGSPCPCPAFARGGGRSSRDRGPFGRTSRPRRAEPALARDELVVPAVERSDEDRLENAMLANGRRQLLERCCVEGEPRLF